MVEGQLCDDDDDCDWLHTDLEVTISIKHIIMLLIMQKKKMAIILPTGQWYAPSAVINDAWYCMVLHCIA